MQIQDRQEVQEKENDFVKKFKISDLHHQALDFGQFCYVRPCVSVAGCCHLFKTEKLLASQGFDLRFSPTQYDDLEFDIRNALQGEYAVYQGHAEVRHMEKNGKASMPGTQEYGNSYANLYKLHKKYSQEEYNNLILKEAKILAQDFFPKLKQVKEALEIT